MRPIDGKWLVDTVTIETGWKFDADRNKVAVTEEVTGVAVTNVHRNQTDANGTKTLVDSLLLITDSRAMAGEIPFIPAVGMGITWEDKKFTIESVSPFMVRGKLHHWECVLV